MLSAKRILTTETSFVYQDNMRLKAEVEFLKAKVERLQKLLDEKKTT